MNNIPATLPDNPLPLFCQWYAEAMQQLATPTRDAMTLATASPTGAVSARIVLCKGVVQDPGYLVFYTNYESAKGTHISLNPQVAAVFHWDEIGRQARIEGIAVPSPAAESDAYFASRDKNSQIGAWTSAQSHAIANHQALLDKRTAMEQRFAAGPVPRPPHWGGYRIMIGALELWDRGAARLHDRARWERNLDLSSPESPPATWRSQRLQP
jgi:pyridoxamine 5'-phosphate oxidase